MCCPWGVAVIARQVGVVVARQVDRYSSVQRSPGGRLDTRDWVVLQPGDRSDVTRPQTPAARPWPPQAQPQLPPARALPAAANWSGPSPRNLRPRRADRRSRTHGYEKSDCSRISRVYS